MASTSAFFTDSDDAFTLTVDTSTSIQTDDGQIDTVYELHKCSTWITEAGYLRVALQFPDELMADAVTVVTRLQQLVPDDTRVFILGDTSYGSCCVDEVAAQHYNADAVIHYGRSCLSQPCAMPVLFVFGQRPLDVNTCVEQFSVLLPDVESKVIILYDTVYAYACDDIVSQLVEKYKNLYLSTLNTESKKPNTDAGNETTNSEENTTTVTKCGRTINFGRSTNLDECSVFYIGQENLTFTNFLYNFPKCPFYSYNPESGVGRKESINVNKMLMKRYFMIEKAKDAKIVGILVGTLGVANYLEMLTRLKLLLKKTGRKCYVFIVGKINVAKLANFMEIDIFVLIACSENALLDSSEFYKPVVTPYEMELACNTDREWTGEYPTDYRQLLPGGQDYVAIPDVIETDETDISLVTGKLRHMGPAGDVETGTSVVLRSDNMAMATQANTAAEYLEMRSWQGLEQKLGETPVTTAVEGQRGIAMGYTNEPGMEKDKT